MCLDVSCHTVDNVRQGNTGVSLVSVVVDNCRVVNRAVRTERPQTLVPMHMPGDVEIYAVL